MLPLQHFSRALLHPDLAFATLADLRVQRNSDGLPPLMRTTHFAEVEIAWQGHRWLLSLPLTRSAFERVERVAPRLRRINTTLLTEYRILPDELRWGDPSGEEQTTHLVLQRLPAGISFAQALRTEPRKLLLEALDELRAGLRKIDFSHNNLKAYNLCWAEGRFVPLRYHDAKFEADNDTEAFELLRQQIEAMANLEPQTEQPYNPLEQLTGHHRVHNLFEGLVCVEDEGGWGFANLDNKAVIPALYDWVGDFHEGRAEVMLAGKMGLIDRTGEYIIPPHYEQIAYNPATSLTRVRKEGLWAIFDYLGRQLTPFAEASNPTLPVEQTEVTRGLEICN